MKYTIKNNITKIQRSIAYVLLLSELLTSCGFKETIVPCTASQEPKSSTCSVPSNTSSLAASDSTFQLSITTIEDTKLTFTYTLEAGLQATYQDATMPNAIPVQQYPVIQDVTGVKKPFSKLTSSEATLLASEGKWKVNAQGALHYRGMLGRGGMQKGGMHNVSESEEVSFPLSYSGEQSVVHVYQAPKGKVIAGYLKNLDKSRMTKAVSIEVYTFAKGNPINFDELEKDGYELQESLSAVSSDDSNRLLIKINIPDNDPVALCVEGEIKIFLEDELSAVKSLLSLPIQSVSSSSAGYPKASLAQNKNSKTALSSSSQPSNSTAQLKPSSASSSLSSPSKGGARQIWATSLSFVKSRKWMQNSKPVVAQSSSQSESKEREQASKPAVNQASSPLEVSLNIPYKLMTPSSKEVERIQEAYMKSPVKGWRIASIEKIRSKTMLKSYEGKKVLLHARKGSDAFKPKWTASYLDAAITERSTKIESNQQALANAATEEEKNKLKKAIEALEKQKSEYEENRSDVPLREAVHVRLMGFVNESGLTTDKSGVKEILLWHGTQEDRVDSILRASFANLATTDKGFYGKGLYFTPEASYAYGEYGKGGEGVLLFNKVCFYSAYPVVCQDDMVDVKETKMGSRGVHLSFTKTEDRLTGRGNYGNHDAHFIPVSPKKEKEVKEEFREGIDPHGRKKEYYLPTKGAPGKYHEFVVFEASQILPEYKVKLQKGDAEDTTFYDEIKQKEEAAKKPADKLTEGLAIEHITQEKLDNPNKVLTVDESIAVLKNCLEMGKQRAKDAKDKDLLIFIGNTGAGKSTTVNYLAGCEMEYVDMEDLGLQGEGEIVRVKAGPQKPAVMPIGYTNLSKTFLPTIIEDQPTDTPYSFTYCDCPGFFDNRGPEINIANAANIQAVVSAANSVRIMLLLNYHSLKADRSRGIKDIDFILREMLGGKEAELSEDYKDSVLPIGSQEERKKLELELEEKQKSKQRENIRKGLESTLIAITQVPTDGISSPKSLCKLRNNFQDFPLLKDANLVTFDVWDETIPGGIDRGTLLAKLATLPRLSGPSKVFNTVLLSSDESRLRAIDQELNNRIKAHMEVNAWQSVSAVLDNFVALQAIDHRYTQAIYADILQNITQSVSELSTKLKIFCMDGNYQAAKATLSKLTEMSKHLDKEACKHIVAIERESSVYLTQSETHYQQSQAALSALTAQKDELGKVNFLLAQKAQEKVQIEASITEISKSIEELATKNQLQVQKLERNYKRDLRKLANQEEAITKRNEEYASEKLVIEQAQASSLLSYSSQKTEQSNKLVEVERSEAALRADKARLEQAAATGSSDQQLLELKRLLGNNYVGEGAWGKLGIEVAKLPAVSDKLLQKIKTMQNHPNGEQPLLVLDLGKSIADMEQLCKAKGIKNMFINKWEGYDKLKTEECYQAGGRDRDRDRDYPRWLLLPGSDHGVLPGSRRKSYDDQVQYMEANYPDYRVGKARELIQVAMLKYFQDKTILFCDNPSTFGNCADKYQKGDWQDHQIALGGINSAASIASGYYKIYWPLIHGPDNGLIVFVRDEKIID